MVPLWTNILDSNFIDLFVSQVTPLSDSRFAWCLDFSPQPTVAFLNLAGQRKYTTCSMDSKLHFGPFADEEGHTIPFPGSLRRWAARTALIQNVHRYIHKVCTAQAAIKNPRK